MDRRMVTVGKFLAKHLRHTPEALGLELRSGGWVPVDELVAAADPPDDMLVSARIGHRTGDGF
jgi:putative RNA 2'-phosphotransferase